MSKGLGRVQKYILDYLDRKAKESKITDFKTVEAYANATELSANLRLRLDTTCQAIDSLIIQNRIRVYPNGRKRNRFYGSLILPSISTEEILYASKFFLNDENMKRQ